MSQKCKLDSDDFMEALDHDPMICLKCSTAQKAPRGSTIQDNVVDRLYIRWRQHNSVHHRLWKLVSLC